MKMTQRVAGVIAAAGSSARMGRPKALLNVGGSTFIETIIRECTAAPVSEIVVVLGADHERIRASISGSGMGTGGTSVPPGSDASAPTAVSTQPAVRIVVNEAWESGRLSSIVAGLDALERSDCSGALIWPVDHPLVGAGCIREMIRMFEESPGKIVIPVFAGRRGHPILLPRTLFGEVRQAPADPGLRAVVHAHAADICEAATNDEGVLVNIDTPEDLAKHIVETDHGK